jgi:hypothetical protein
VAVDDEYHMQQRRMAKQLHVLAVNEGIPSPSEAKLFKRLLANPDPLGTAVRQALQSALSSTLTPAAKQAAIDPTTREDAQKAVLELLRNPSTQIKPEILEVLAKGIYLSPESEVGPGHMDQRLWCGYFDQGFFKAPANPARGFPEVHAHLTDIGPSLRLHDGIDLGVGFGWVTFDGDRVTASPAMTVTPLRLVMRPGLIAVPEAYRKRWMGILSVYWKETYVIGRLNAADFGSQTDPFQINGELIRSFGFTFDITSLFPAKWGFK